MSTITSSAGTVESVTVRRTESSDAQEINLLISPSTVAVFGRVNVIHLLEKANLAVTLSTSKDKVLAHASFSDHPMEELVDQACWENYFTNPDNAQKMTPLNTLFLRLFVAQPSFSIGGAKEIVRTVFNAIVELEHICLMTPYRGPLEAGLEKIFGPLTCLKEEIQSPVYVCHRHNHCPRLHVRRARVEDHDDIMQIFADQIESLVETHGPYFLSELIESQGEENHAVVCEIEGCVVGFVSLSDHIDLKLLNTCFELGAFEELRKTNAVDQTVKPEEPTPSEEEHLTSCVSVEGELDPGEETQGGDPSDTSLPENAESRDTASCEDSEPDRSPNAFCIQLFTMEKRFEMRSADLLPYLFTLYPDREYCVISVPKPAPEFPLLQSFLRIIPRENSTFPHELYLCHRWGLLRTLEVRVAVSDDIPAVQTLIKSLNQEKSVRDDLDLFLQARKDADGAALQAFVFRVKAQIVGLMIIRDEEDIEFIQANFDIERFMYFSHHQREEHGRLCHFILNPICQHHGKHFFKEALRLAHKTCLYYPLYPTQHSHENVSSRSLAAVLNFMVPVSPRRQIIYPLEELGINAPSRHITRQQDPFALYYTNRKLSMEPKVTINSRIVVVGASDTGLAFLEALTFSPHLRFNNLTLISTHGLPDHAAPDMGFLATSHCYSSQDHAQLSFRSWISVVTDKMKAIDREAKHVELASNHKVQYDCLILCAGLQCQMPSINSSDTSIRTTGTQNPPCSQPVPSNLFSLNDQHDCGSVHRWLIDNFLNRTGDAVVYGSIINVYTCVETLIRLGVSGGRIHIVHPPDDTPSPCFHDSAVELAVKQALEEEKVHVHHDCLLAQINDGQHPDPITCVSFTTAGPPIRLQCAVLFNFSRETVDRDAFRAINDACLVFDGRLVIDRTFRTNDPSIYAAGPLTKYSRRYHADQWTGCIFNSKEVGRSLASVLLPLFDPTVERPVSPSEDHKHLTPVYNQAKIQGGRLPGSYNYLHVTKPNANNTRASSDQHGCDIVTGRTETGNYFCLHLSQHDVVETITCLSKNPLPISNLLCLHGKHQMLLNHLRSRYNDGLVQDLYSYFRENWCLALFHDRFTDFEQEVRQIMDSAKVEGDNGLVSMHEVLQKMVGDKTETGHLMNLSEMFGKSQTCSALKTTVLDYLKYNRYHLTMYARPGLL
ncbi:LOW QUALITY PROTEIN: cilia- and flagella-associated protein 61 [Triplophysa dalaica]|uniref:LOW QUALITY PROTEIN: cilia- and flagella-associated protein 61 n=1 Tax=Triplophysa dalaica TaxID=1582913 RepID=UPI0024DFB2F8|nr:LOW QUALITY PROTEIN: cilia- and flagella-associated protein 61 [Triplophysa dalaica]